MRAGLQNARFRVQDPQAHRGPLVGFLSCLVGIPVFLGEQEEERLPFLRVLSFQAAEGAGGFGAFQVRLRDGELHHLHFEDVPADPPREMLGQPHRQFPGEGITPLRRIVEVLKRKGYAGPASLEMFSPAIQAMDPYQVAMKARATIEPLIE